MLSLFWIPCQSVLIEDAMPLTVSGRTRSRTVAQASRLLYHRNPLDRLTAISGDIPRFPLTSSESVLSLTPRAAAAPVIVKPDGSMDWRKTTPPGAVSFSNLRLKLTRRAITKNGLDVVEARVRITIQSLGNSLVGR